jgi:hypothetical protein
VWRKLAWDFFRIRVGRRRPRARRQSIGRLQLPSGALLLADPCKFYDPLRVEGFPPGAASVQVDVADLPAWGPRVARLIVGDPVETAGPCEQVGSIGVDSAQVAAVDAHNFERFWAETGPDRIGETGIPKEHHEVAELLCERFGLHVASTDEFHTRFAEPISEELEGRIMAFLQSIPEYTQFPFFYFRIKTNNTVERLVDARKEGFWRNLTLDDASGANVIGVDSGIGDGRYPVFVRRDGGRVVAAEVEFIDPDSGDAPGEGG